MYLPIRFMLRIRDIERLQLNPKIHEVLEFKDLMKLSDEKDELSKLIEKHCPEIRC